MTQPEWTFLLKVPSHQEAVAPARHTLNALVKEQKAGVKILRHIGLAVTEALNNAIENQAGTDADPIELEARFFPGRVELVVRGHAQVPADTLGKALDSAELPDEDLDRGRGLFLIKSVMDKVEVKTSQDGHVEIWMVKSI